MDITTTAMSITTAIPIIMLMGIMPTIIDTAIS